jgi:hypothetical protein
MESKYKELQDLDIALRSEADVMLRETGLGRVISNAGYQAVGSYVMHTMTWRDLDFERSVDDPTWAEHWEFGKKLAETGLIWKFSCVDAYRDRRNPGDKGFYWGIQFDYPAGGPIWKVDLWSAREEEWGGLEKRALWISRLTDETRSYILEIKNAICELPEYRKTLLSVHIYVAVLEDKVRGLDDFWGWWRARYGGWQADAPESIL